MLSCGKVIGHLSKITRNVNSSCVQRTPKFIRITGAVDVRHASSKKNKKSEIVTEKPLKPDACPPNYAKKSSVTETKIEPPAVDPAPAQCTVKQSGSISPTCEEICGKIPPTDGQPPEGSGFQKYWKQIFAALVIAGVTVYAFTRTEYVKEKVPLVSKKKKEEKKPNREKKRIPANSMSIPPEVPYLLVGGGTAAFSAFRSIKSKDPKAKVLVISEEADFPYMRPPLSKELWYNTNREPSSELNFTQWNGTQRSLYYEPSEFYTKIEDLISLDKGGVAVASGWKVNKIDVFNKIAVLNDGYEIKYDKCLIATGGSPKNLPIFEDADDEVKSKILLFRTKDDFLKLEEKLQDPKIKNIVIVGGGFLGSELACSLAKNLEKTDKRVFQIYKEKFIMSHILPEYLSDWTTKKSIKEGIISIGNSEIEDYDYKNGQVRLTLSSGRSLVADQIIVAVGVDANTELADASALEIEPNIGGFLVNAELEARRDLWVAGDAACFYDVRLGRRRVEHHDHAVISGRLAGENMTGAGKPYLHQSMFWSDLGPEVGYEAIGIVDSSLPTVSVFAKVEDNNDSPTKSDEKQMSPKKSTITSDSTSKNGRNEQSDQSSSEDVPNGVKLEEKEREVENGYGKGVIFYLKDDIVVGIILWNIFNRMSIARQVLARGTKYNEINEIAKLFSIHEDQ